MSRRDTINRMLKRTNSAIKMWKRIINETPAGLDQEVYVGLKRFLAESEEERDLLEQLDTNEK